MLDLGTFVFFNFLAFTFLLLAILAKNSLAGVFALIGMIVFYGIALIVLLGNIVILEPSSIQLTYNSTNHLMTNSTTLEREHTIISGDYSLILNPIYLGLGTFSFILFVAKKWPSVLGSKN
jgi:hypothetical protein